MSNAEVLLRDIITFGGIMYALNLIINWLKNLDNGKKDI